MADASCLTLYAGTSLIFNFLKETRDMAKTNPPKKLFHFLFQGLIILAPIVITIWAVVSLFNFVDSILPNLLYTLFPDWIGVDQFGYPKRIPGLGFLIVIVIVLLVGYVSSSFIFARLVDLFE